MADRPKVTVRQALVGSTCFALACGALLLAANHERPPGGSDLVVWSAPPVIGGLVGAAVGAVLGKFWHGLGLGAFLAALVVFVLALAVSAAS